MPIDLKAIEDRANAATPIEKWKGGVVYMDGVYPVGPYSRDEKIAKRDADFIAHARADVPALIEALRNMTNVLAAGAVHAYEVAKKIATIVRPPSAGIDGEERAYSEGHRMALRGMLGYVIGGLAGDGDRDAAASALAEREDVRAALRRLCEAHGSNEWPDDLHLGDVIRKHLEPYLNEPIETPIDLDAPVSFRLPTPSDECTCATDLDDPDALAKSDRCPLHAWTPF